MSGGNAFLRAAPGTTLGEVGLYEIVPEAQTGILRVAAAQQILGLSAWIPSPSSSTPCTNVFGNGFADPDQL